MATITDLDPPARQVKALLAGLTDDQMSAPTPCEGTTVGDLLDHLMMLTAAFRDAAEKALGPTTSASPPPASAANLPPNWRRVLPERLDALVAAWRKPDSWEGTTQAGGVTMPAAVTGTVALNELVLHGWDLARATGQPFDCDADSASASIGLLSELDDATRSGGFGPAVPVPADAPLLDRAVGLSGRDPAWRS